MARLDPQDAVRAFHERFGYPIADYPQMGGHLAEGRLELLEEEVNELRAATAARDLVALADALGDLLYLIYGYGVACGIDVVSAFWEIHRSNMTKTPAPGRPKPAKGPSYSPPRIAEVLGLLPSSRRLEHRPECAVMQWAMGPDPLVKGMVQLPVCDCGAAASEVG